jgi:hypothetical protein
MLMGTLSLVVLFCLFISSLARLGARVTATDQAPVLETLQVNIDDNKAAITTTPFTTLVAPPVAAADATPSTAPLLVEAKALIAAVTGTTTTEITPPPSSSSSSTSVPTPSSVAAAAEPPRLHIPPHVHELLWDDDASIKTLVDELKTIHYVIGIPFSFWLLSLRFNLTNGGFGVNRK